MENRNWPLKYMFKFISSNQGGKVDKIKALLPETEIMTFKHTSNLKYVSVTCIALMDSADQIIEITEKVDKIEGVIVL
jgi:putative lipoic acid-binding regulatory protein